jgi:hypothetical protein
MRIPIVAIVVALVLPGHWLVDVNVRTALDFTNP